ncbi:hypothetical protein LINPERPRIM_LOCUS466 [Linum perenne]
MSQHIPSCKK